MSEKLSLRKQVYKLSTIALIIIGVVAVFHYTRLEISDFKPEKIKEFILGFGIYAPIVYLVIYTLRSVILVLPVGLMSAAGGLAFGIWWGWLLNVLGATLGSCMAFWVMRYFGEGILEKIPYIKKSTIERFYKKSEQSGLKYLLFMRFFGFPPYDIVNFGSGLSKVKFRDYVIATPIGMIPGGFVLPYLGSIIEDWRSPKFLLGIAIFVFFMFIPYFYKKFKKSKVDETA